MLSFGITFKPEMSPERLISLTRQAETAGFSHAWSFDSHILWLDPYPLLTLMAVNSRRLRLGTLVTNPIVRDPTVTASLLSTLNIISAGRMDLGIGRGDSSRRVMGKPPAKAERLEQSIGMIRTLCRGDPVLYDGKEVQLSWAPRHDVPVWIAGYGPKVLKLAGRIADGVVLQFADPPLIEWCLGFVRAGARESGRDFSQVKVMSAAPVWVSEDLPAARERVRWFPALVSNHVVDLAARYKPEELPPALTEYVQDRNGYDYLHHAEVGSSNGEFVPDWIVDRYCIVGTVDDHLRKLRQLQAIGVTQFNIYLMCGDEEETLEVYGSQIVPALT